MSSCFGHNYQKEFQKNERKKKIKATSHTNAQITESAASDLWSPVGAQVNRPLLFCFVFLVFGFVLLCFGSWVKHKPIVNDVIDVSDRFSYYLVHLFIFFFKIL